MFGWFKKSKNEDKQSSTTVNMHTKFMQVVPRFCRDCEHYVKKNDKHYCYVDNYLLPTYDLVTGEEVVPECANMRNTNGFCGPSGFLYKEKNNAGI